MTLVPGCAAFDGDRSDPDLRLLPDVAGDVTWISDGVANETSSPLVVTADWATKNSDRASRLFAARSSAGAHTIVVPKFRPGVWTKILGAPTKVEVIASEFRSFEWQTVHHAIPGFVVFRSSLHAAKWGQAPGLGVVILGYRPTLTSGVIVLCSAVLTAKVMGVALSTQQALYRAIVEAISLPADREDASIDAEPAALPSSIVGASAADAVAARVRQVKGFQGGRFYVNEWREMFAPKAEDEATGRTLCYYIGRLGCDEPWFPKPHD